MNGLVMKSTGSWYAVRGDDGRHYQCRTRGKLRLESIKETNPIAVGDRVELAIDSAGVSIEKILERTNHMLRQSVKKTGHAQVLAANIDQALVVATHKQPRTSLGFIDRFLASAESFRIPQLVVINKRDLLTDDERADAEGWRTLYQSLGAQTFIISAEADTNFDQLLAALQNKVTLMAGHSGAGKSTLLNRLAPHVKQAVGEISDFSNKGTHTTTFAEMFEIQPATFVIDTPGVKEWGLVEMEPQEISDYFREMRDLRLHCRFGSRCLHVNEPTCAVRDAVEKKHIAPTRYKSYLSMVGGEDNRK